MAVMQISRKIDYALRAVIYLTLRDDRRPCSVAEIAAQEGIPKKFLEKIIQDLIRHGLVRSTRGAQGGYALAHDPEKVTFKDVLEAIVGPVSLNVAAECSGCGRRHRIESSTFLPRPRLQTCAHATSSRRRS
jgi:Rrf2 family protein